MKKFLAFGDTLINVDHLAYAAIERGPDGSTLRLNFGEARSEVQLQGADAQAVLQWLRLHAISLSRVGDFEPRFAFEADSPATRYPVDAEAADRRPISAFASIR